MLGQGGAADRARLAPPGGRRLTCLVLLFGLLSGLSTWTSLVEAQAPVQIVVDTPTDGSVTGPDLTLSGWAMGLAGDGLGVDSIVVFADGAGEDRGRFLGTARYGLPRPDVAAARGDTRATNLGY